MAQDAITITGIEQYQEALRKMQTDNPSTKKELQAIIRRAISEARKNIVKDAQDILENDPRNAYKAVRSSVYKQILGAQVNILSSRKRGAPTKYQRPRKLDENPHQRGGNRRPRSSETLRYQSYEGVDRGFILRFLNAGTVERETRFGSRGALRARQWFGISSAFQMDAAASRIAEEIESLLQQEFHTI
jgi:hypothetical protein